MTPYPPPLMPILFVTFFPKLNYTIFLAKLNCFGKETCQKTKQSTINGFIFLCTQSAKKETWPNDPTPDTIKECFTQILLGLRIIKKNLNLRFLLHHRGFVPNLRGFVPNLIDFGPILMVLFVITILEGFVLVSEGFVPVSEGFFPISEGFVPILFLL